MHSCRHSASLFQVKSLKQILPHAKGSGTLFVHFSGLGNCFCEGQFQICPKTKRSKFSAYIRGYPPYQSLFLKSNRGGLSLGIDLVQKSIKKANTPFKRSSSLHIFIEYNIEIRMRLERDSRDRKVVWATEWIFFMPLLLVAILLLYQCFSQKKTTIASTENQTPCLTSSLKYDF